RSRPTPRRRVGVRARPTRSRITRRITSPRRRARSKAEVLLIGFQVQARVGSGLRRGIRRGAESTTSPEPVADVAGRGLPSGQRAGGAVLRSVRGREGKGVS